MMKNTNENGEVAQTKNEKYAKNDESQKHKHIPKGKKEEGRKRKERKEEQIVNELKQI